MRFMFIIQGEGRGHFTQALVMRELFKNRGDEVCAVLVGKSVNRQLPGFFTEKIQAPVFTFESPNFLPTPQNKRPRITQSIFSNLKKLPAFIPGIRLIHQKIDELQPDAIINFYELLSGLSNLFFPPQIPVICIGHQYLFLHPDFYFPPKSKVGLASLRFFTRLTAIGSTQKLALSFYDFPDHPDGEIIIVPPLLRQDVLNKKAVKGNYIHGYLLNSGYASEIEKWHRRNPKLPLHFFWDKKDTPEQFSVNPNFTLHKINDHLFLEYMAGCKAYATTAGFESVCEALFLQKPVLMVPAHIEQECNAWDAMRAGAGISSDGFDLDKLQSLIQDYRPNPLFRQWAQSAPSAIYEAIRDAYTRYYSRHTLFERLLSKIKIVCSTIYS